MSRCVNMASPVTTLPLTDSTPSSSSAALCSLVLASTRSWARTALTSGAQADTKWTPGASPSRLPRAVLPSMEMCGASPGPSRPSIHRPTRDSKSTDVDPAEDPRVGGLAEAPPGGEPEVSEELPAPLLAVLDDRLVAGHAREHGDDGQGEQGGERVTLAPGGSWIVKALKEFHQRGAGFHARVLIRSPSGVIHHIRWI